MQTYHNKTVQQTAELLGTDIKTGLTHDEVKKRLHHYGKNELIEKKKKNIFIKFLEQFNDFMIIVLIIAAIISAIVAKTNGSGDYIDSIIIIAIVIFNAIMGLIQEEKAEKSLEALKKMSAPNAKVRRNGKIREIEASKVVPGDIVMLEAGNYVPADCRLIDSYNLQIEESSLTGETLPTSKQADIILNANTAMGDLKNMAFATTIVVNGHAEAVVVETGMNTKVGQIAGMIIENESPETPLQKKLGEVGKTLAITCMIICGLIFLIGIWKQIPITEMFMTSVGLAVAAIPEGLPAIVTIMLSIGVTKMAKKNNTNNTNTLPEQELNFIVSDVRIPRMVPLQTLADESGISYKALWQMCKQNKIVHIKSGNKFLVNVDKFIEFLNTGETEVESNDRIETRGRKSKDTA